MPAKERPESLEGRWDILYRDYPEVYEEWGQIPMVPDFLEVVMDRFPLEGKVVVDVGSGTGISTFQLARRVALVIGIEVEEAMISVARSTTKERGVENVRFELGAAQHLLLADSSVDAALAITCAAHDTRKVAQEKVHVYYVCDLAAVLERLRVHLGTDFFPLANNVFSLWTEPYARITRRKRVLSCAYSSP